MKYFVRFIDSSKLYSPTKHMEWYKIAMFEFHYPLKWSLYSLFAMLNNLWTILKVCIQNYFWMWCKILWFSLKIKLFRADKHTEKDYKRLRSSVILHIAFENYITFPPTRKKPKYIAALKKSVRVSYRHGSSHMLGKCDIFHT